MIYDWLGFFFVAFLALAAAAAVSGRLPKGVGRLLMAGVALRILGSFLRYEVLYRVYDGIGDATGYYGYGLGYAEALRGFDFSIFDPMHWWAGNWWGTQFVRYVSGVVLTFLGPSMRGEFLVFSLLSFFGLCLFGLAFHRAYPHLRPSSYLTWLWLWPSLWFWPSSVGKDALLLLAAGLVTAGYVGRRGRTHWWLIGGGLLLATAVRPHVAIIIGVILAGSWWLGLGTQRMTVWRIAQGLALVGVALVSLNLSFSQLGLAQMDVEGVQEFVQKRSAETIQGGGQIQTPEGGLLRLPLAFVNILMRPFPWEAHNPQAMVASLELVVFWFFAWRRRRRIVAVVTRYWRKDRLLRFALPMALTYVLLIGMVFGNLGIIARQRIFVFPFLFLLLEAIPREYFVQQLQRWRRAMTTRAGLAARVGETVREKPGRRKAAHG